MARKIRGRAKSLQSWNARKKLLERLQVHFESHPDLSGAKARELADHFGAELYDVNTFFSDSSDLSYHVRFVMKVLKKLGLEKDPVLNVFKEDALAKDSGAVVKCVEPYSGAASYHVWQLFHL